LGCFVLLFEGIFFITLFQANMKSKKKIEIGVFSRSKIAMSPLAVARCATPYIMEKICLKSLSHVCREPLSLRPFAFSVIIEIYLQNIVRSFSPLRSGYIVVATQNESF
jgi:hypothetical protein